MASIIPEYNYDIFISYRQKDNKYDGWVTEFVDNLKKELESTFKEDISVYFDINPHDGLLETHDVDESLKEKLKCLIFIPIISRTYCDPKAFAWEHEFKVFVEQSSKDKFGLKVKLPNGNVASRVLPVIIYDLDKQDIKLCESVLGGVLRGVEFIYKEPGVNRPLRSNEEKPHENLYNTIYRNQVNKVANTIKDVLYSLFGNKLSVEETVSGSTIVDEKISDKQHKRKKPGKTPSDSLFKKLRSRTKINPKVWQIIALVSMIVVVGLIWLYMNKTPSAPDRAEIRYDIPLNKSPDRVGVDFAISPDGKYLVYSINRGLNIKQLNSDVPSQPISGTPSSWPFFSPDSKWIGIVNEDKIMKIPVTGGNPILICELEVGVNPDLAAKINRANWYENKIIYAVGSNIYSVPDIGGTPEQLYPLVKLENNPVIWNPQLLPDRKTLLFSQQQETGGWGIFTWRLGSKGSPSVLVERGRDGRYLKSGHVAYTLNNNLYITKFNPRTNRKVSESQIIATNPIWESPYRNFGQSLFDFSENGILVYCEQNLNQVNLVWLSNSGEIEPITREAKDYGHTAISSDAQKIAVSVFVEGKYQIEIINTNTGTSTLFAKDAICPVWSVDDSSVYYVSTISGNQVFKKLLDNTPPVMLFEIDSVNFVRIQNLSSDSRYLDLYVDKEGVNIWDIGYYDMVNNKVEILKHYNSDNNDFRPAISPDGKWVAYVSNNSGQSAIYVAPFPGPGESKRVTSGRPNNDINFPVWSPDMSALYYYTTDSDYELWEINMQFSENNFDFEDAHPIFNGEDRFVNYPEVEIHPDSDHFLLRQKVNATEEVGEVSFKIVGNWEQEML